MNQKKKLKNLKELEDFAAIDEAIRKADSEHCEALDKEHVASKEQNQ